MSLAIRMLPETVRSLAFGSITGAYAGVGTAISNPARIIFIQNLTDVGMMFSFDGVHDHFPLGANSYVILDITSNKTVNQGFFLAEGQRLYVKQLSGAASSGSVYLTTFYGSELN
jgi:hypothetical protein